MPRWPVGGPRGGGWILEVCAPCPEVAPEASFDRVTGHFLARIAQGLFLGVPERFFFRAVFSARFGVLWGGAFEAKFFSKSVYAILCVY